MLLHHKTTWTPGQRSGRLATKPALPRGLSQIPTDSHSLRECGSQNFFPWIYFSLSWRKKQASLFMMNNTQDLLPHVGRYLVTVH